MIVGETNPRKAKRQTQRATVGLCLSFVGSHTPMESTLAHRSLTRMWLLPAWSQRICQPGLSPGLYFALGQCESRAVWPVAENLPAIHRTKYETHPSLCWNLRRWR